MILPAPTRIMPDTNAAMRNASLFGHYVTTVVDSPAVQLAATEVSPLRIKPMLRDQQPNKVRFEPVALLLSDEAPAAVAARLDELPTFHREKDRDLVGVALARVIALQPTVVVCHREEVRGLAVAMAAAEGKPVDDGLLEQARRRFLDVASTVCSTLTDVVVADAAENLAVGLSGHERVLIFTAGLQTGVTMQHLVISVQGSGTGLTIGGLVLHAHPHSHAGWASVRNTFGGGREATLLALWLTYLPVESPFSREQDLLLTVQDEWFEGACFGARNRWRHRLEWLSDSSTPAKPRVAPPSPLWSTVAMKLRPTSLFGAVDDRRLVAAMGAALTEKLDQVTTANAPEWVQIDLLNALRSYFDGILHASLLRWVHPARAWWGSENECRSLIDELRGRFDGTDDWRLLLAELLLAASMGKLPAAGTELLLDRAKRELETASNGAYPRPHAEPDHELGFVELGYILAQRAAGPEGVDEVAAAVTRR